MVYLAFWPIKLAWIGQFCLINLGANRFLIFRNLPRTISRWDSSAVSVPSKFFLKKMQKNANFCKMQGLYDKNTINKPHPNWDEKSTGFSGFRCLVIYFWRFFLNSPRFYLPKYVNSPRFYRSIHLLYWEIPFWRQFWADSMSKITYTLLNKSSSTYKHLQ